MPRHLEQLSGGLVTSRDPIVLAIGELSLMQNAVYRPGDQAVYRALGRELFGACPMVSEPVVGLRDLKFDNGDHFLLALQGSLFSSALVADTGTFASATSLTGSGAASALDAIQFNNRWHLFSGIENLIMYTSATAGSQPLQIRRHGLQPNTVQVSGATGAGTWTAGATGYFEYWFTEVLEYTQDGVLGRLESTFAGQPFTLFASSTAMQASITLPGAPTNTGAGKWILYRGGPKTLSTDKEFPTGFKLAEGTFGTTTVLDGSATTGAYVAATTTAISGYASMVTPTNVFASDNAYATHAGSTAGAVAAGFATFTVTEPIVGITVDVEAKLSAGLGFVWASVSNDGGTTWSTQKNVPVTSSDVTYVLGGAADLWDLNWTSGNLVAGQFLVRVVATVLSGGGTVSIDFIRAKITSAGTQQLNESVPFPAIVISAAGVDAAVGSRSKPPVATTGDIFQGCLVTNSRTTGEQALIRYSLPAEPDYFPVPYFLDFETPDNDVVTNIKTLNNRLGVFLASRLYRVNYLPTEADADFNRGICREEVSAQEGCVNAMCACIYSGPNGRSEIAFVSNTGINSTDLFSVRSITDNLDWRGIIGAANSTPIALVNDPEHSELLFFYKNSTSGSEHYRCLHLSYDAAHLSGGRLKISGPVHMRNHVASVPDWVTSANGSAFNASLIWTASSAPKPTIRRLNSDGTFPFAAVLMATEAYFVNVDPNIIFNSSDNSSIGLWFGSPLRVRMLDSTGGTVWTKSDVLTGLLAYDWDICSDGAGGCYVLAYQESGAPADVRVTRINSAGAYATGWTAAGISVTTETTANKDLAKISPDGFGGVIVSWQDARAGTGGEYFIQRINSAGIIQWAAGGIQLSTDPQTFYSIGSISGLMADGMGGAFLVWNQPGPEQTPRYVYAQHVSAAGTPQWTAGGVLLASRSSSEQALDLDVCLDKAGGAIFSWNTVSGGTYTCFTQRLNSLGAVQWTAGGVATVLGGNTLNGGPHLISDGTGGAIAVGVAGSAATIRIQRISPAGVLQWGDSSTNGVTISTSSQAQRPRMAPDGLGGAIVTWQSGTFGAYGVRVNRVDSVGTILWGADGILVASGTTNESRPHIAVNDLSAVGGVEGGATFADLYSAWSVTRTSGLTSLYLGYGGTAPAQASAGAGKVYMETGNTIPALDSKLSLRPRRLYLAGVGNETRLDRIYAYTPTGSAAQTLTFTPRTISTNASAVTTQAAHNYSWNGHHLFSVDMHQGAEGLELDIAQASNNAGMISFQHILMEHTGYGAQDSGHP